MTSTELREAAEYIRMAQQPPETANEFSQLLKDAANEIDKLREAMQEFVDRCDRGEVRSTKTYNKFKTLLGGTDDRKDPV